MNAAKPSIPKGDTNVWITASMVGVTLLMVLAVVGVILVNGLGYFWPHSLQRIELRDAPPLFVRILETETREQTERRRLGNDTGRICAERHGLAIAAIHSSGSLAVQVVNAAETPVVNRE